MSLTPSETNRCAEGEREQKNYYTRNENERMLKKAKLNELSSNDSGLKKAI